MGDKEITHWNPQPVIDISISEEEEVALTLAQKYHDKIHGRVTQVLVDAIASGSLKFEILGRDGIAKNIGILASRLYEEDKEQGRKIFDIVRRIEATSYIVPTDLRHITRHSDICRTVVWIENRGVRRDETKWITLGQTDVLDRGDGRFDLQALATRGFVDCDQSSARAISIPLIGLRLVHVDCHQTRLKAYIAPRKLDSFHMPWPDYNPALHPKSHVETFGDREMTVMADGYWYPPVNKVVYRHVQGREVTIVIDPTREGAFR